MNDAMSAEFDTLAEWTAEVAAALGPGHHLPAACRGSGSPAALDWLLAHLELGAGDLLVDSGAGVGGPAGYAATRAGVRPVLVEPEAGACRAARRLFGLPTIRGDAGALPFAAAGVDAAWSLGVLCTMSQQLDLLRELARITLAPHRIGLIVYAARRSPLSHQPEGNDFPTPTELLDLITRARLRVDAWTTIGSLPDEPTAWRERGDEVDAELERRHGTTPAFQVAQKQSATMGELIGAGELTGEVLSLRGEG